MIYFINSAKRLRTKIYLKEKRKMQNNIDIRTVLQLHLNTLEFNRMISEFALKVALICPLTFDTCD